MTTQLTENEEELALALTEFIYPLSSRLRLTKLEVDYLIGEIVYLLAEIASERVKNYHETSRN